MPRLPGGEAPAPTQWSRLAIRNRIPLLPKRFALEGNLGMDTILDSALTNSRIVAAFRERTRGSADLAQEASELFPSGITHDSRHLSPYGVYVTRAEGL